MISKLKERIDFARFCITHKRSLSAIRRWQERRLRQLVRHAAHAVPLWKDVFAERGIDPDSINSIEDLARIPVTRKETFIGKMPEEYIDSTRPHNSFWYSTSGTSGTPFTFLMSEHALSPQYADFASLRFLWWRGYPLSRLATVNVARIKIRGPSLEHRLFVPVADFQTDPEGVFAELRSFRPDIVMGYPSILLDMARMLAHDPALFPERLRFALSFGEMLLPPARKIINEAFGTEVYDRYGCEEIGVIGIECAQHNGFHINSESVVVEVTDENFNPLPAGRNGKIVVTDLFNFGMPFIRYETGDTGIITNEACTCGLRSPRIWIEGRYSAYLTFGGRRYHHLEFDGVLDRFMNSIVQYQVVKRSEDSVIVRIVAGPALDAGILADIRERMKELMGEGITIDTEQVSKIPRTPTGKSKIVVDENIDQ